VQFSIDAGGRLDAISEKLSVQVRYSYAVVERPIDIPIAAMQGGKPHTN
jgi:hypothetical protein